MFSGALKWLDVLLSGALWTNNNNIDSLLMSIWLYAFGFVLPPWYDCTSWLGVKHQVTYLLVLFLMRTETYSSSINLSWGDPLRLAGRWNKLLLLLLLDQYWIKFVMYSPCILCDFYLFSNKVAFLFNYLPVHLHTVSIYLLVFYMCTFYFRCIDLFLYSYQFIFSLSL